MAYLVAVDGGGTKTAFALARPGGAVVGEARAGGTSLSRRSAAEVEAELAAGLAALLAGAQAAAGDCAAVCAGMASAGQEKNRALYQALLARLLPRARVQVLPDAEIAWQGAGGGADSIVVIAGTGSIAWGRYQGRCARAGGAGPGRDAGSADWIGRQAVAAGLCPTPADGNFAALLPGVASQPGLAPILEVAAVELARLLQACADALDWPDPVASPVGGVFHHMPAVGAAIARHWPHAWRPPLAPPLSGALALAARLVPA